MQVERLLYRNRFICNPLIELDPFFYLFIINLKINNYKKYRILNK